MSIWFKNLQVFSIASGWQIAAADLEVALSAHPLLPCNAASMQSQGWLPPHPAGGFVYSQGKNLFMTLGIQQRLLPTSVINQATKQKAAELEKSQGFAPGRKQLRDLKERVADELRPRAFVREKSIRAWIDLPRQRLIVDTPTPKAAEDVAAALRNALGEFPVTSLATHNGVGAAMTAWLSARRVSAEFVLDQDCELVGADAAQAAVRYVRHGLDGAEIRSLIQGGKSVSRLGLIWRERLSFVLTDQLALKRLRFQSMETQEPGSAVAQRQNEDDQFDAGMLLLAGELGALLDDLVAQLGGPKA